MTEIKQPKIRFKGHISDWEQRKLGEVVEFYSGLTYSPKDITKNDGTFVIRSSNIKNNQLVNADNVFVKSEKVNSKNVDKGDIVVVVRNGSRNLIGKHAVINKDMPNTVIGAFMTGIKSETPDFINALLNTRQFDIEINKNLGATINQITTGSFKNMLFNFTNKDEQEKIGEFFKTLDETIAINQQKLEVTKQFKQTMLKKMFPKNGETTPEIRFKGFTDDWENKKFLDICSVKKGTQLNKDTLSKEKTETFKYPVYNGSVNPIGYTTESNKEKGLIMTEGGDVGRVLFSETPFWSSGHSYNISSLDNNIYYLQYLFESNYGKINSKGLGVTIKNLSLNSLKQIILTVNSSYQEQELIGNYFKELDNQINDLEQKLETYKEFKKSMLQKMFI